MIIKKIRNIMAERLFLVTNAIGINDEEKNRIWEAFQTLLL